MEDKEGYVVKHQSGRYLNHNMSLYFNVYLFKTLREAIAARSLFFKTFSGLGENYNSDSIKVYKVSLVYTEQEVA